MKFHADLEGVKKALATLGKAAKKISIEPTLIKLEAKDGLLTMSLNGVVGAKVSLPAEIKETGTFVTGFAGINILTVRKCSGILKAENADENTLLLKYNGGKAKTVLTKNNTVFTDVATEQESYPYVELPMASMKQLTKETLFAADMDLNSKMHAIKMDIADDEEGIVKFVISACNGRVIARRSAYAAKAGTFTGSVTLLPEQVKSTMDMLSTEGNVRIAFGDGKVFFRQERTAICFQAIATPYPNLDTIIDNRDISFTFQTSKAEFIDVLNSVLYLQGLVGAIDNSVRLHFEDNVMNVSYTGNTEYTESLNANVKGSLGADVYFAAELLKEVVGICPNDEIMIGGSHPKAPFWMTCGDKQEYLYCILPKLPKTPVA